MPTSILVEILKLRRSLVLLLCLAAPACVAILSGLMALEHADNGPWSRFALTGTALWAYFMLPMTVTALTVLMAQMEHGPKAWNHLLATPQPRWRVFAAKLAVLFGLIAAMSLLLLVAQHASGWVVDRLSGGAKLTGAPEPLGMAWVLARMFAGALMMGVLQLWVALRFRSFVPPLVLGIAGTFVAVAATAARQGAVFPWLLPVNALASDAARADQAIGLGFFGGLALMVVMLIDLSRREA
ncbi:MAG TPA: ABC transporter permease [Caulobacteraceae bacterium]|jgi:ABC-2 type transport system permease protein